MGRPAPGPFRTGREYAGRSFEGMSEGGAVIADIVFEDCSFLDCSFPGAEFRGCEFRECRLLRCDLGLIHPTNSLFDGCGFEDSRLIGVNWTEAAWNASKLRRPLRFLRCVLDHSTFLGLDLSEAAFEECIAHDVDFREADLARSTFCGTDLAGSLFGGTDLSGADLSAATNYRIHPAENRLEGARFSFPEAMALLQGLDIELVE